MAVQFRAESHSIAGSGASANPGEPIGTAQGDFLVGMLVVDAASSSCGLPTGWTSLYSVTSAGNFKAAVGYIVRGASAAATTFVNQSAYREAYILAFRSDASATLQLDAQSSSGGTGTASPSTHPPDPPAVTAVAAASMAVCGGVHWIGSITGWVAPTGYTIRSNNASGNDGTLASKSLSAAGSEDPGAFSPGGSSGASSGYWDGFTMTIAEAAASGGGTFQAAWARGSNVILQRGVR